MNLYADASAILRWLLGAENGEAIAKALGSAEAVFLSRIGLVEIDRVLVRQRIGDVLTDVQEAEARRLLARGQTRWTIIELSPEVSARAGQAFPREPVRALDAVHLASALFAARVAPDLTMLSTDQRLRENAVAVGLALLPP